MNKIIKEVTRILVWKEYRKKLKDFKISYSEFLKESWKYYSERDRNEFEIFIKSRNISETFISEFVKKYIIFCQNQKRKNKKYLIFITSMVEIKMKMNFLLWK